jgi:hypothetical protein
MFKKKCYLCGGEIVDGMCAECGLRVDEGGKKTHSQKADMTERPEKIRANTGYSANREMSAKQEKKKDEQANKKAARKQAFDKAARRVEKWDSIKRKKAIKLAGVIVALVVTVIGIIADYAEEKYDEITTKNLEREPYDNVVQELSDTGESYEVVLEPGEYKVGVHLPEGSYTVHLEEGQGTVSLDDSNNSIYMWQYFGDDKENDEIQEWSDVRLFQGALFQVSGNVRLKLNTENGQNDKMITQENPLTEEVLLRAGETVVAGEDFPEGIYDFQSSSEWTNIIYKVPLHTDYEDDSMNYLERSQWITADDLDSVYRNIVLTAGTTICSEDADSILVPSKLIETQEYDSYYDIYRY